MTWISPEQTFNQRQAAIEEQLTHGPIIPLEQARFVDRVDRDHERQWRKTARFVVNGEMNTTLTMLEIWNDNDMPPVIQDRALLVALGSGPVFKALGFTYRHGCMGGDPINIASKNKRRYERWFREAVDYQHDTELVILSPSSYVANSLRLFDRGNIDDIRLEELLAKTDPREAQPTYSRLREEYELPYARFPLLDDILSNEAGSTEPDAPTKLWAAEQLHRWLDFATGKTEAASLPQWLQKISDEHALDDRASRIYKQLFANPADERLRPRSEYRMQIIEYFGWEVLRDQADVRAYNNGKLGLEESVELATWLEDPKERRAVMLLALQRNEEKRQSKDEMALRLHPSETLDEYDLPFVRKLIRNLGPNSELRKLALAEIAQAEQAHSVAKAAQRAHESTRQKQRAKNNAVQAAKRRKITNARQNLQATLDALRT